MRARRVMFAVAVVLAVVIGQLVAAHRAVAQDAAVAEDRTPKHGEYRMGAEDILYISVWKNEVLSRAVTVRPDGRISLPLVGDIQAAGLTPPELQERLARKLGEYMPAPEVAVIVNEVKSFKVSIIGEVARPGRYELKSWHTVLDVLALAGGFTQFAARSRILIVRPNGNAMARIPFNYTKFASEGFLGGIMNSGGDQENFYLRPGDIILVP